MTITTTIYTALFGHFVGEDAFGNRYYCRKNHTRGESTITDKRKNGIRWVIFKGKAEPSKVPPQWHGWLHYTHDAPLDSAQDYAWEKPHVPNLTGTVSAYVPPGHLLRGGHREASTSDYKAWVP